MFSASTYVNPYVDFEKQRTKCIPLAKLANVTPAWTHKTNISQIQVLSLKVRKEK